MNAIIVLGIVALINLVAPASVVQSPSSSVGVTGSSVVQSAAGSSVVQSAAGSSVLNNNVTVKE